MGVEQVHVLMVTLALQGHINPMLRFAKTLVSKGIHVTLTTTENARHRLLASKISTSTTTTTTGPKIQFEFFSDGLPNEFDRDNNIGSWIDSLTTAGATNLANVITDLNNSYEVEKFSCVITSPFVPWVIDVASKREIPVAVLWIQACAVFSIYYQYTNHATNFPSFDDSNSNQTVQFPGLPLLKVRDIPTFILPSTIVQLRNCVSSLILGLEKVNWVLANSFHELEEEIVNSISSSQPIWPIGPLVSPFMVGKQENVVGNVDLWNAEDSCMQWLDKKKASSVIYVSFGSITMLSQKQMDNVATALKNSNMSFLWVVKTTQNGSGTSTGELSAEFLDQTRDIGLVVSWCVQEKVLMHPTIACFMTHCGWNSTLETVAAGVPVIGYPQWSDQPLDAKLLVDVFKIGVKIQTQEDGSVTTEEVERCIFEVTAGPKAEMIRKRAVELKDAARKGVEEGGYSDNNINRFIKEIMAKSG